MTNQNPTVRIGAQAYSTLKELSARSGESMQDILDRAIEAERRRRFVEQANSSYERIQRDQKQWSGMVAEREAWDSTLMDGIDVSERSSQTHKPTAPKRRKKK